MWKNRYCLSVGCTKIQRILLWKPYLNRFSGLGGVRGNLKRVCLYLGDFPFDCIFSRWPPLPWQPKCREPKWNLFCIHLVLRYLYTYTLKEVLSSLFKILTLKGFHPAQYPRSRTCSKAANKHEQAQQTTKTLNTTELPGKYTGGCCQSQMALPVLHYWSTLPFPTLSQLPGKHTGSCYRKAQHLKQFRDKTTPASLLIKRGESETWHAKTSKPRDI